MPIETQVHLKFSGRTSTQILPDEPLHLMPLESGVFLPVQCQITAIADCLENRGKSKSRGLVILDARPFPTIIEMTNNAISDPIISCSLDTLILPIKPYLEDFVKKNM